MIVQVITLVYFAIKITIIVTAKLYGHKTTEQRVRDLHQLTMDVNERLLGRIDASFARALEAEQSNTRLIQDVDRKVLDVVHSRR